MGSGGGCGVGVLGLGEMGDAGGGGGGQDACGFDEAAAGEFDVGERGWVVREGVVEVFFDVGAAWGAHSRASFGLMAGDRYRTTSQHGLTKRTKKKMQV